MSALICGSVAFDNIMVFKDRFKNHILPEKTHVLSVSFLVPEMRKEFGGCAGNIAYNLKLLGEEPLPMATVGTDFEPYAKWMDKWGIIRRHVTVCDDAYTAQAFITTDLDDNQITAFHPGAMNYSHLNEVGEAEGVGRRAHTRTLKEVMQSAIQEARKSQHRYVGTEHLILGLLELNQAVLSVDRLRQLDRCTAAGEVLVEVTRR